MSKNLKVLISAYACKPNVGSEPGVGWNMVRELAQHCSEVWVFTRSDNQVSIEAELKKLPVPGLHFVYYNLPGWSTLWKSGKRALHLNYYLWQIATYFKARKLHREIDFDLAHHITYGRYCVPSFLALLPIPFVWGPVGGGEVAPKSFWTDFSFTGKMYETLRDLSRWIGERDPFVHLTVQRSAIVIVSTPETAAGVKALGVKRIEVICGQTGISQEEIAQFEKSAILSSTTPVRFLSMGRLLHWKGFHLGLRAFAAASLDNSEYWIIGDGPEKKRLEALAVELGIAEKVRFLGQLPREQALTRLGESTALVHPSLHDFSPTVCIEAMAAARPVICLELGGPAVQITEETGFKIPAHTPEQSVQGMAEAMKMLASDPQLQMHMGQAGQKRVRELYQWNTKGKFFAQLYQQVLGRDENSLSPNLVKS